MAIDGPRRGPGFFYGESGSKSGKSKKGRKIKLQLTDSESSGSSSTNEAGSSTNILRSYLASIGSGDTFGEDTDKLLWSSSENVEISIGYDDNGRRYIVIGPPLDD